MKICLFETCERKVFSTGYCQVHQYLRTDDKWLNKHQNKTVEPRSPIRRYKLPTTNEQGLKTTKNDLRFSFGFRSQAEIFKYIWETREHKCLFSGSNLDLVPKYQWSWMFLHLLRKGKYPFFKYNPDNIVLGHPNFHLAADNFTEEERIKHPAWDFDLFFQMQQQQKEKYNLFLKENML